MAQAAAGEVFVVVQTMDEMFAVDDRGGGHSVERLGRGDRFFQSSMPSRL